jgi:hypothetical protein
MSTFVKPSGSLTPFGRNEFLRSTKQQLVTESYTVAKSTVPSQTIDGFTQKILQPGTVMAKITSGGDSGKIGPFQSDATDGRQTGANIVGLELTFLPWQLLERDVEVSVVKKAHCVQAWCFELTTGAARIALSNATADLLRSTKSLDITFV